MPILSIRRGILSMWVIGAAALAGVGGQDAAAFGLVAPQNCPTVASPRRVIIDTDPGIDDAIAILIALRSPELHVEALTTVAGNVTLQLASDNARRLLSLAHRADVPVARGAAHPLRKILHTATYWHGPNGMGGERLPEPLADFDRRSAGELISEVARQHAHDLTVVALGPLTNIAAALRKDPALRHELTEIIVMGGSTAGGNETAAAEFNFFVDPDAARVVFESGVPVTMVGLNATRQTLLTRAHADALAASSSCVGKFVARLARYYLKTADEFPLHDPLALAMAIDKSIATTITPMHIEIDTRPGLTNGATIFNASLTIVGTAREGNHFTDGSEQAIRPNADVPAVISSQRLLELLMARLSAPDDAC
jgi:inosine-uridine nucleoside N-ribohydrolase